MDDTVLHIQKEMLTKDGVFDHEEGAWDGDVPSQIPAMEYVPEDGIEQEAGIVTIKMQRHGTAPSTIEFLLRLFGDWLESITNSKTIIDLGYVWGPDYDGVDADRYVLWLQSTPYKSTGSYYFSSWADRLPALTPDPVSDPEYIMGTPWADGVALAACRQLDLDYWHDGGGYTHYAHTLIADHKMLGDLRIYSVDEETPLTPVKWQAAGAYTVVSEADLLTDIAAYGYGPGIYTTRARVGWFNWYEYGGGSYDRPFIQFMFTQSWHRAVHNPRASIWTHLPVAVDLALRNSCTVSGAWWREISGAQDYTGDIVPISVFVRILRKDTWACVKYWEFEVLTDFNMMSTAAEFLNDGFTTASKTTTKFATNVIEDAEILLLLQGGQLVLEVDSERYNGWSWASVVMDGISFLDVATTTTTQSNP